MYYSLTQYIFCTRYLSRKNVIEPASTKPRVEIGIPGRSWKRKFEPQAHVKTMIAGTLSPKEARGSMICYKCRSLADEKETLAQKPREFPVFGGLFSTSRLRINIRRVASSQLDTTLEDLDVKHNKR